MYTPPVLPPYVELHCLTNYTFLRGASHPEELVERAAQLGYAAIAITDECSVAGVVRAHVEAKKLKLPLLIGSSFTLRNADGKPAVTLVALAQTRRGYGNLCELITLGRRRAAKGEYRLAPGDLDKPGEPGLGHLRGLPECVVLLAPEYGAPFERLLSQAEWAAATFPGRCWMSLTLLHRGQDERHKAAVLAAARHAGMPVVATGQVEMHVRSRKPLHDTLAAVRLRTCVQDCGFERASNAEQHLRARLRLANLYPRETLEETLEVATQCPFNLDELKYEYPDEICPDGLSPAVYLRQETYIGAQGRFPGGIPPNVREQIEHELALIAELEYEPYFLTVYDIVKFARGRRILCQGRGSAANSAVCYCLGITEVDPARGNSLFERFISRERNEPPDIDVDFEHQRREEVIQYIYEKYGRDRAALTAVVITYRVKSTLRDTGKALGIDPIIIEAVAKSYHYWDGRANLAARLAECGLDPQSSTARQWVLLAERLLGFPRHLSQHPGGFVISRGPLCRLVPIENAAMADRSVVQWDKDDLDAVGLLKIDVLALGMLSVIRRALDHVSERRRQPFTMQDIPAEDGETYDMICAADTIGTFQIESRAQMSMLPRMRPREFYDLVIEVAIVRPGPIQGGMVHPYLRRRQKLEKVTYPHDDIRKALERTLGVPIFQEQVMQVAMLAAGFTAGEADELRRSMAAWKRKGGLGKFYDKIINGMTSRGYDREFAEQIFRQIQGFGEYGFPESHAASFALLAYASCWLKRHEPEAFLAALLNSQPMGFYSPSVLVQDARRHGVAVRPADVTISNWDARLEPVDGQRPALRLGLSQIKGMQQESAERIEQARGLRPFAGVADLARRASLTRHDMNALAAGNALQALAGHRRAALWEAVVSTPERGLLQKADIHESDTPELAALTEGQALVADYRSLGLTLGRHPVALLRDKLTALRFSSSAQLRAYEQRPMVRACGIVTGRQRPGTSKGVIFVTLEDESGQINLIVRPHIAERQRRELLTSRLLGAYGAWQSQSGVQHLIVGHLVDLTPLLGALATKSRDFH
ncbi:error-prone DNA polymerase [Pollutimonas bauzanensis]|uniref:Error-prone DNA polymerase n=1 Tax=Pollutimonas bauzanensis TaxID=658167 RepID=A0A1M5MQK1_9BURK|nr:error-prone DNA polymerase [Pollutimonas bauzanensis]SHG79558.1 error-prone DNA polymerase [Pollutimonas bauzanensis]